MTLQSVRFLPFIFSCALITWVSHTPGDVLAPLVPFEGLDKIAHIIVFSVLGLTARWAIPASLWQGWAMGVAFALVDEIHQYFVAGRHFVWLDLGADTLGISLGTIVPYFFLARSSEG